MADLQLPNPIIFGQRQPNIRLRVERGIQFAYSTSNYNLFIEQSGEVLLEADEAIGVEEDVIATDLSPDGTLEFKTLMELPMLNYPWKREAEPAFVRAEGLALPYCESPNQPCSMLVEDWGVKQYKGGASDTPLLNVNWLRLRSKPNLQQCPLVSTLLQCCTTPAEKKFAEAYYGWAIGGVQSNLRKKYGALIRGWEDRQITGEWEWAKEPMFITQGIKTSLRSPALIPQVWLNYTYDPHRSPSEERVILHDMPKRVDFVFIFRGKVHIVEIDDPSHYATYDKDKREYEVDEERYTNNLKEERALRQQGFEIHRLSNWEVLNSTHTALAKQIPETLGIPLELG